MKTIKQGKSGHERSRLEDNDIIAAPDAVNMKDVGGKKRALITTEHYSKQCLRKHVNKL